MQRFFCKMVSNKRGEKISESQKYNNMISQQAAKKFSELCRNPSDQTILKETRAALFKLYLNNQSLPESITQQNLIDLFNEDPGIIEYCNNPKVMERLLQQEGEELEKFIAAIQSDPKFVLQKNGFMTKLQDFKDKIEITPRLASLVSAIVKLRGRITYLTDNINPHYEKIKDALETVFNVDLEILLGKIENFRTNRENHLQGSIKVSERDFKISEQNLMSVINKCLMHVESCMKRKIHPEILEGLDNSFTLRNIFYKNDKELLLSKYSAIHTPTLSKAIKGERTPEAAILEDMYKALIEVKKEFTKLHDPQSEKKQASGLKV